jgi:hypothetical protein
MLRRMNHSRSWPQRYPAAANFLAILAVGLAVSLLLFLMRGRNFWIGMTYGVGISLAIGYSINLLKVAVCRWRLRIEPDNVMLRKNWPGWAWMIPCVLLGALIGHEFGTFVVAWLLGHEARGLFAGSTKQLLFAGGFTLLVASLATLFFYSRERLHLLELERAAIERQAAEAQLLALQTQLEPHMLFNTLAHLRILIGLRPADAQLMLDELIAYLRATLQASRQPLHPLATEFDRLRDYLKLMQRRMGTRLQVSLELPAELRDLPVPPMLLQPLVENAIKHGLEPHIDGGHLQVRAERHGKELRLTVQDDGAGLAPEASTSGTRFGTQQVQERLRTQYGDSARFSLQPAVPRGCVATIELPL